MTGGIPYRPCPVCGGLPKIKRHAHATGSGIAWECRAVCRRCGHPGPKQKGDDPHTVALRAAAAWNAAAPVSVPKTGAAGKIARLVGGRHAG